MEALAPLLPWLNLLLLPILKYVMSMERRLVRLETIREVEERGKGKPAGGVTA
jgi:hypothetical protein